MPNGGGGGSLKNMAVPHSYSGNNHWGSTLLVLYYQGQVHFEFEQVDSKGQRKIFKIFEVVLCD